MKIFNFSIVTLLTIMMLFSCNTNKKLNQKNAEKAIKNYFTNNSIPFHGSYFLPEGRCVAYRISIDTSQITSIEQITQLVENEANSLVHLKYLDKEILVLNFHFNRNIDKHWLLTSVSETKDGYNWTDTDKCQNLSMMVQ